MIFYDTEGTAFKPTGSNKKGGHQVTCNNLMRSGVLIADANRATNSKQPECPK